VFTYEPSADQWTALPDMSDLKDSDTHNAALVFSSHVFLVGAGKAFWLDLHTANAKWLSLPVPAQKHAAGRMALLNNRLYLCGGNVLGAGTHANVSMLDLARPAAWQPGPSMRQPRCLCVLIPLSGPAPRLFALTGSYDAPLPRGVQSWQGVPTELLRSCEVLDPQSGRWEAIDSLPARNAPAFGEYMQSLEFGFVRRTDQIVLVELGSNGSILLVKPQTYLLTKKKWAVSSPQRLTFGQGFVRAAVVVTDNRSVFVMTDSHSLVVLDMGIEPNSLWRVVGETAPCPFKERFACILAPLE